MDCIIKQKSREWTNAYGHILAKERCLTSLEDPIVIVKDGCVPNFLGDNFEECYIFEEFIERQFNAFNQLR